jgi:nicotinamide-nucleotide amidase
MTVADGQEAIEHAIAALAPQCDVLIISGGLGPTLDDLTRQAIAAVLGVELEVHPLAMEKLTAYFARLKRPMAESNKIQAMIPRGADMIENTCGTAPGIAASYRVPHSAHSCRLFAMPGVPSEMKAMFARDVLPQLTSAAGGAALISRTLHTFGMGESNLGQMIAALMQRGRNPSVGTTVANSQVSLRINSHFPSRVQALAELEKTAAACRQILGDLIFGEDDQTLAGVVAQMLVPRYHLAIAESGVEGVLARMLSDVPGSNRFFAQGWIASSDQAKTAMLQIPPELLSQHAGVSESVAGAMAAQARQLSGCDFGLAVAGVADASADAFGSFAIALAHADGVLTRTFHFTGDRDLVRDRSAKMALTMLRYHLLGKTMPF